MTIFYIKMKIRAGGGSFRAAGGNFWAAGCSPLLFLFMGNTKLHEKNVLFILKTITLYATIPDPDISNLGSYHINNKINKISNGQYI